VEKFDRKQIEGEIFLTMALYKAGKLSLAKEKFNRILEEYRKGKVKLNREPCVSS